MAIIRVIPVVNHLLLDFPPQALDLFVELGRIRGEEDELELVAVGGEERAKKFRVVHARVVQKQVDFPRPGALGDEAGEVHEERDSVEPLDVLEKTPPGEGVHRANDVDTLLPAGRGQARLLSFLREALLGRAAELEPALVQVHDDVLGLLVAVNPFFFCLKIVLFF